MSQTKTFACIASAPVRVTDDGSLGQGDGGSKRIFAGRHGSSGTRRNYDSYLRFALDWTNVKSITSAILTLTTDDGLSLDPAWSLPGTSATPKVSIKRLVDSFSEGNNADGDWDSSDFTSAKPTASGAVSKVMSKVANGQTDINITAIVKAWAPGSVVGGGKAKNFGIGVFGYTDTDYDWAGWSRHASANLRPFITLTYELGPTAPNAPTNVAPVGAVASIGAFQGDFTDSRATDTLSATYVQVYPSGAVKSGTAATDDRIAVAAHGFKVGQEVWFHSLTGGVGLRTDIAYFVRAVNDSGHFKVATTPGGTVVNITNDYSALTVASPLWSLTKVASNTEIVNDRFNVLPEGLTLLRNTNYQWRARVKDQEARWSAFNALSTFSFTNTNPNAPSIAPLAQSYASLNGVVFQSGTFSDPDAGDKLLAYQVQMSSDVTFANPGAVVWDTGKVYVAAGSTNWETQYGGIDLLAGTYYWRARVWDNHDGLSNWTSTTITLTANFNADPGSQSSVQFDPYAPWRVRIREMAYNSLASRTGAITGSAATDLFTSAKNHGLGAGQRIRFSSITGGSGLFPGVTYYVSATGLADKTFKVSATSGGAVLDFTTNVTAAVVTAVTTRGPGLLVGSLENAKSVGATLVYNSPGEAHFTLPVDHPFISIVEPKQVHYGIDFYTGDGWRETFAGLVWDADATETSVVFPCIDYLALYDGVLDERYYPAEPDRSYTKGGSKYTNVTIRNIVIDQLNYAKNLPNSPVGFISVGSIATMNETVTMWSTMQPVLSLVGGLLESHKQGTGKKTRIQVRRTSSGGYEVVVEDDPGQVRDNLRLAYGELVQGYRVVLFGNEWASRMNTIGRTREGIRVLYKSASAPGIDQRIWGRWARAIILDNVSDEKDAQRRALQAAIKAGKLGSGMALAVRTGVLKPRDGYDICDVFPIKIKHGIVDTDKYGSGYWVCLGIMWEASDDGSQTVTLTLLPRQDTSAPDGDLIGSNPIHTQPEWQIGFKAPDPLKATSRYWLDQSTGKVYIRDDDTLVPLSITGTV